MSDNITQWLTEIRNLQRQLADLQKERDQALASAANWRRLYETEADQRRMAVAPPQSPASEEATDASSKTDMTEDLPPEIEAVWHEVSTITSVETLQTRLQEAIRLCHTLQQQLAAERVAHAQTRQTLTTALGDAFDSFKGGSANATNAGSALAKSPQKN